jgi:hypothetical protein
LFSLFVSTSRASFPECGSQKLEQIVQLLGWLSKSWKASLRGNELKAGKLAVVASETIKANKFFE